MNKTITIFLITHILILSISPTLPVVAQTINTKEPQQINTILYVDDDNTQGPWNGTQEHPYQYIHQAVENASNQDTIYVYNGTYNETITIDKTLQIQGQQKQTTIIDGHYNPHIIQINKEHVTIQHFTIRNSGGHKNNAGIQINTPYTNISHCIIYRTKTGIYLNTGNNHIYNSK